MNHRTIVPIAALLAASDCSSLRCGGAVVPARSLRPIALPDWSSGIGFDDLVFARGIRRLLVPAGRTGKVFLVDPDTKAVTSIKGFSTGQGIPRGAHEVGPTSSDEGTDALFVIDRTADRLSLVDLDSKLVVALVDLPSTPDYVRYVSSTSEVWVTEPMAEQIEVFSVPQLGPPELDHVATIPIAGGPESLVIDPVHGLAYTHLWNAATVAIDLHTHAVSAEWANGCLGSRGIALDAMRGFLFAACDEGKVNVLDLNRAGAIVSSLPAGAGVDLIAYNPTLRHLYVPASDGATLSVMAVSEAGRLSLVATAATVPGAHCVVADDRGCAWVCDPEHGQLLLYTDAAPP